MACQAMLCRYPMVASAMRQMISTSDFRCGLAGSSGPREECTQRGVLHRDPLRAAGLDVLLGAALGGQDQRGFAADQVGAVQLGRDVHRHPCSAHRLDDDVGVRRGLHEITAEAEVPRHIDMFGPDRFPGFMRDLDGVHAFGIPTLDGYSIKATPNIDFPWSTTGATDRTH